MPTLDPADFVHVPYDTLTDHQGWVLSPAAIKTVLHRLRTTGTPLECIADIRGGFATLKKSLVSLQTAGRNVNALFVGDEKQSDLLIEKAVCRNAIKANSLKIEDDFDYYVEKIIFPYKYQSEAAILFADEQTVNRRVIPLEEAELATHYPDAYSYLCDHRQDLAQRDKGAASNYQAWYAYGRAQGLNVQGYKLLFPHISDRPYFVYTEDSDLLFYTGFSIVSWNSRTLKVLQKVLTSDLFWFFVKHTSKPYSGEYFGLGKNFIKDFSIPAFDEQEEEYLLACTNSDEINAFLISKYDVPLHVITKSFNDRC